MTTQNGQKSNRTLKKKKKKKLNLETPLLTLRRDKVLSAYLLLRNEHYDPKTVADFRHYYFLISTPSTHYVVWSKQGKWITDFIISPCLT